MIERLKVRYLRKNSSKKDTKDNIKQNSIYTVRYNTFGGMICPGDYDAHRYMSDVADRISIDLKFDEQCRRNIENRKKRKK